MPEWETIPEKEKYAKMARQGHGFIMALPVRVIKTEQPDGVLINVERDGKEIGEIVFEGNICAKGYYKDAEATRKLWLGGVLHSGDLAVWHPDGAIQILDRAKDIIISGKPPSPPFFPSKITQHPQVAKTSPPSLSKPCSRRTLPSSKLASAPSPIHTGASGRKHL
jgi:hypothetical protein